jgi:hypothetical protein
MDTLRGRVGDATVLHIAELDATAALQGLIPKFDLADVTRAEWLTPDFVDEDGQLRRIGAPGPPRTPAAPKRCAESDTLLIGAHFADPVAGRITANGSGFGLVPIAA